MLFSEVSGRKIVSTSTAETVGKVDDFVIDPNTRSVISLQVKKAENGSALDWPSITAVGDDAVTVADASVIGEPVGRTVELTGKDHRAVGKRVLTTQGDEIGKVKDVDFDPASGALTALRVDDRDVPGANLIGIGSYAVVVRVD